MLTSAVRRPNLLIQVWFSLLSRFSIGGILLRTSPASVLEQKVRHCYQICVEVNLGHGGLTKDFSVEQVSDFIPPLSCWLLTSSKSNRHVLGLSQVLVDLRTSSRYTIPEHMLGPYHAVTWMDALHKPFVSSFWWLTVQVHPSKGKVARSWLASLPGVRHHPFKISVSDVFYLDFCITCPLFNQSNFHLGGGTHPWLRALLRCWVIQRTIWRCSFNQNQPHPSVKQPEH